MKKLIYTNDSRLSLQTDYNNEWTKAVNAAIVELKSVTGELTDEQITKFLSDPSSLCAELVAAARKEYDAYMEKLPKSVQLGKATRL